MYKYIFLSFIISISLFTYAQEVENIVQKHIQAIGGEQAWKEVKTMESKSTIHYAMQVIKNHIFISPKGMKQLMHFEGRTVLNKEKEYFQLCTPSYSYKYLPDQIKDTVLPMLKEECTLLEHELTLQSPFLFAKEKGNTYSYVSTETLNYKEYYKLHVRYNNFVTEYVYINTQTYLIEKIFSASGDVDTFKEFISYKKLNNGILFPIEMNTPYGNITITEVKINEPIDVKMFLWNKKK